MGHYFYDKIENVQCQDFRHFDANMTTYKIYSKEETMTITQIQAMNCGKPWMVCYHHQKIMPYNVIKKTT